MADIKIEDLNIHYNLTGPEGAPVIVLLHGWGCNHTTLASVERIVNTKYRTYNLDLPGFGQSDEPKEVWGVERYTQLVERFISQLGLENPILLGHSFGGRISILMASRHPEIPKIILTDAAGVKPKRPLKYYWRVYKFKAAKRLAPLLLGKRRAEEWIQRKRNSAGSADYNNASPMMKSILSKCVNEDLCSVMPSIQASTLLIWGENDTATPLSDAKKMERLIPDAGLVSFPGCGHYSFLDNPGQYAAVLRSFLKI